MKCGRCGEEVNHWTSSVFNTEYICKKCRKCEKEHPLYGKAVEVNRMEFSKGNYCFAGIGLPEDLILYRK